MQMPIEIDDAVRSRQSTLIEINIRWLRQALTLIPKLDDIASGNVRQQLQVRLRDTPDSPVGRSLPPTPSGLGVLVRQLVPIRTIALDVIRGSLTVGQARASSGSSYQRLCSPIFDRSFQPVLLGASRMASARASS